MAAEITLRPYQQEAVDRTFALWDSGESKKPLIVLPTGTGKTIVFAKIAEKIAARGQRVLILAHREELLKQAADKLKSSTGLICSVEKAEQTSVGSWNMATVGSVQTLCREKRLSRFEPDRFGLIVVDEAHHAIADTYQAILRHFTAAKVLGVTATPDRSDMKNLGQVFDALAYEYTLPRAIKDGYLCKIKAQTLPIRLDISGVSTRSGDFALEESGAALEPYLEAIAEMLPKYCLGRKTVVFLPLVATSQKMVSIINARAFGLKAREVNGNSTDRAETLAAFERGEFDILCNSMLLTEGWDCPAVDCIIVLRPTKSRALYCQMVGRGTRIAPGKDHLLLLDFLWLTSKHRLCRPASLICKDDEVADRMTRMLEEEGSMAGAIDIEGAAEEAASEVAIEREQALAKELAALRKRKAKLVDPVQFEYSLMDENLINYMPAFPKESEEVTQQQVQALEKFGINGDGLTCGKAKMMLKTLSERASAGLATAKQIRLLEQRGFLHVGQWSFDDASALIGRISAAGWKIPSGIGYPGTYIPPGGLR